MLLTACKRLSIPVLPATLANAYHRFLLARLHLDSLKDKLSEKELRKGGKFQALEEEVKTRSHEIVRLTTILDLKKSSMSEESDKKKTIEKNVKDFEGQLKQKIKVYEKLQERYKTAHDELAKQMEEVEKTEELLQTLQTGVASRDGQENGYQGQLQDAKNRTAAAATEQEQAKNPKVITEIVGFYKENTERRSDEGIWHKFDNAHAHEGPHYSYASQLTPHSGTALTPLLSPPTSPRFPRNVEDSFENPRAPPPVTGGGARSFAGAYRPISSRSGRFWTCRRGISEVGRRPVVANSDAATVR